MTTNNFYVFPQNSNDIYHYGIKRKSGRYPWGSGERPYQSTKASGDYHLQKRSNAVNYYAKSFAKGLAVNIAAAVIPGFGLVYNAKTINDISKSFDMRDYTKKEGDYEKISSLRKKDQPSTLSDDLKNANPRIGQQRGKINNCINCVVATDMRRRGYDVQARSTNSGNSILVYTKYYKDLRFQKPKLQRNEGESKAAYAQRSYDNVMNTIEQYGDGARGLMSIQYEKFTGANVGHAMYWEVSNGRAKIYDPQSGGKESTVKNVLAITDPESYVIGRLDNLKVTNDITQSVVSRKGK